MASNADPPFGLYIINILLKIDLHNLVLILIDLNINTSRLNCSPLVVKIVFIKIHLLQNFLLTLILVSDTLLNVEPLCICAD